MLTWFDAAAYSSLWVSLAAAALCLAAADAMTGAPNGVAGALALCGTLVVYNVDRLRDLERDRETTPARTAFVSRHRRGLVALSAVSGVGSLACGALLGPRAIAALAPVLVLGLLHRRLKRLDYLKTLYIALAWVAVVVGLPAIVSVRAAGVPWVAGIVGATMLANVTASNLRDDEAASAALGEGVPLRLARACAVLGLALALLGPEAIRALAWIPLATLLALVRFDDGERYGHLVVDGALLVGGLAALLAG